MARCGGGGVLAVLELEVDGALIESVGFAQRFGPSAAVPETSRAETP